MLPPTFLCGGPMPYWGCRNKGEKSEFSGLVTVAPARWPGQLRILSTDLDESFRLSSLEESRAPPPPLSYIPFPASEGTSLATCNTFSCAALLGGANPRFQC
eukprot:Hpha_TRINITY_DN16297_c3_g5::TRINITY_DN16297_c3_g5_i2::g.15761::m.15761